MSKCRKTTDWSDKRWKEMLVEQRRFLWRDDTIEIIAAWAGFKPGMTVVDIGSGLGFLGYTLWPYFGEGGNYIGVDLSHNLLQDAKNASAKWSTDGRADFIEGEAEQIPLPDNIADLVMCQVLLIHLEDAGAALDEMIRITKPGGTVLCIEPDNLSASLVRPHSSMPELSIEQQLLAHKINLLSYYGRIKLGRGDWHVGAQIPRMMQQSGLERIDVRVNDRTSYMLPPYDNPRQKHRLGMMKENFLDEEKREFWMERDREEFLAGGGTDEEYDHGREIYRRVRPIVEKQVENGEFFSCVYHPLYIIKGTKPEIPHG